MASLYLSAEEYWESVRRISRKFVKSVSELPARGFADKLDGYEIYLSENEVPSPNPDFWVVDSILTRIGV